MVQLPSPSAVAVPSVIEPASSNVIDVPATLVPVNVGLVFFVRLSMLELPVSVAAVMSGTEIAGGVVSITIDSAVDTPTLPAESNTRAEMV